jgi:hypothetical protein
VTRLTRLSLSGYGCAPKLELVRTYTALKSLVLHKMLTGGDNYCDTLLASAPNLVSWKFDREQQQLSSLADKATFDSRFGNLVGTKLLYVDSGGNEAFDRFVLPIL